MEVVSLKRKKRKQTFANVAPIYIFILAWLVCALIFKMYTMSGLLASIFISAAAAIAGAYLISRRKGSGSSAGEAEAEEAPKKEKARQPKAPDKPLDPEVAAVVEEGHMAIKEMGRLYGSIQSPEVRERINELMRISTRSSRTPWTIRPTCRKYASSSTTTCRRLSNCSTPTTA